MNTEKEIISRSTLTVDLMNKVIQRYNRSDVGILQAHRKQAACTVDVELLACQELLIASDRSSNFTQDSTGGIVDTNHQICTQDRCPTGCQKRNEQIDFDAGFDPQF
ncbi:hypothetical protein MJO28_001283 [Puccinia striiformis f. sp. tritici]|uniref:Uncharacterized protein n=1 Tax=Puccinia striiformis f. sp. tritici TaxID=168172 RepID=A0ACC0ESU9_9BASI|nr:hypothetical protein MJO28_001283 [Puccinia striiformis f. sp. tritici]KAI7965528.1 hypothetical protein MJO29_001276 [Puccinia striiformis f. sp. tritici]